VTGTLIIAGYTLRECVRRRVFVVVLVLSVLFLGLYWFGTAAAFDESESQLLTGQAAFDEKVLVGSTLLGLSMFTTLFLGAVLAAFLTLNGVRGDADRQEQRYGRCSAYRDAFNREIQKPYGKFDSFRGIRG